VLVGATIGSWDAAMRSSTTESLCIHLHITSYYAPIGWSEYLPAKAR